VATFQALPPADECIAADSGVDHARLLGVMPTRVVGDFDSASADAVAWAENGGATIERHPRRKDQTDLELAMERAHERCMGSEGHIIVVGVDGSRPDHVWANISLLGAARYRSTNVEAVVGDTSVRFVHGEGQVEIPGQQGATVSLLPLHGDAQGVRTRGLDFPLDGETLLAGSPRGVSNTIAESPFSVHVALGTLAVFRVEHYRGNHQ